MSTSSCAARKPVTALAEFSDPYLYPGTNVLRNKLGMTVRDELDAAEADLVIVRAVELDEYPVRLTADLTHLLEIHRRLFQDVYDWAGQVRSVDISKSGGFFMPRAALLGGAAFTFAQLHEDNLLRGLSREVFLDKLTTHFEHLNYLHPFREGNGRTQRLFWSQVAAEAGHPLDWTKVMREENNEACRIAMADGDLAPLRAMLDHAIT